MARMRYGMGEEYSDPFQIEKGVRQGCGPAPLLFSLFLDELLDVPAVAGRRVPMLFFSEDAVLMAHTENAAHGLLGCSAQYCEEKSLTINWRKTMDMTFQPSPSLRRKLAINNVPIDAIKRFDYLSVRFFDNLN
ncbi:hypothetical protein NDU88_001071 [Pleurodeles waltl]|uniref:Reverse transcriptase domain-containing protein n=1 Tax=Pleurodeles waltl TaxID=8319 RepID=A0AAV7L8Q4_PLEWA|nr:hypothetical protein NDU88_001071 [Pleurodeles waltl]